MIARGQRFGRYELAERVGQSDRGVIYKAKDVPLGRSVALRLVPADMASDGVVRARLNREATALAAIDHPNVPPIYEATEQDGQIYIASRWIDGVDLGTLVSEEGPLDPVRAVRIVNQVASALQAAHAIGIMHRSVKPSTVMVDATDHAYLTDFALARRSDDITGLTAQADLASSFDYLAPEYIAGAKADRRVDIYGLGCVLYEALTGEVPFDAPGPSAKMYAHASAEPPSPHARRPEVPERLDAVVRRALAKEPDERQQSAAEFAIEAAMGVDLSPPLWAAREASGEPPPRNGARDREAEAPPEPAAPPGPEASPEPQPVARRREREPALIEKPERPASRDDARRGSAPAVKAPGPPALEPPPAREGFHEPVYFLHEDRRPRSERPRTTWIVPGLIFIALLVVLLLALAPR